jgi:hypothetical protein
MVIFLSKSSDKVNIPLFFLGPSCQITSTNTLYIVPYQNNLLNSMMKSFSSLFFQFDKKFDRNYGKYQKINIRRYLTIYINFNDKIATDQCCYNIRYRLRDVTALSEEL